MSIHPDEPCDLGDQLCGTDSILIQRQRAEYLIHRLDDRFQRLEAETVERSRRRKINPQSSLHQEEVGYIDNGEKRSGVS
jgi:hypothetical protein